jgi:hypothetical protein
MLHLLLKNENTIEPQSNRATEYKQKSQLKFRKAPIHAGIRVVNKAV